MIVIEKDDKWEDVATAEHERREKTINYNNDSYEGLNGMKVGMFLNS